MMPFEELQAKARWVWKETLKLHRRSPETRIASCLSDIDIFVVLYYGEILNYDAQNYKSEDRDRLIVSKGHGAVSLYPVLADLNFFDKEQLDRIGREDSFLSAMPDTAVPGFETINGSLGHGLGVACGVALGLKAKESDKKVFVLTGDGELNEGAVWEAAMFASHHRLNNLILIVDNNKMSMLGYQKEILDIEPLGEKFGAFGWKNQTLDGHNVKLLHKALSSLKNDKGSKPKALIANTRKGNGIPELENDPLCHVKILSAEKIDNILRDLE